MKKIRRTDREMSINYAKELLKKCEYGILSTVDKEDQPYGTPLSYIYMENCIYFHCALEGMKLDNIKSNNKICFTVVGKTNVLSEEMSTEYESVMAFGNCELISGQEKEEALTCIVSKYSPEFIEKGMAYIKMSKDKTVVVKINLEYITGKHRV